MVGLDPQAIKELKEVVLELRDQGVTVLISTHMLEMVNELWDIVYIMDKGRIRATYTREQAGDQDLYLVLLFDHLDQDRHDRHAAEGDDQSGKDDRDH